jgi:tRNA modification GTPase
LVRTIILTAAGWRPPEATHLIARVRLLRALQQADAALARAAGQAKAIELFAEELRLAQQALGEIAGEFSTDDLLGEIFSRFCIGK